MADTAYHALLALQTPTLTFTKSQGQHWLPGLEQHAAEQGQGAWLDPGATRGFICCFPGRVRCDHHRQGNVQSLAFQHGDLG